MKDTNYIFLNLTNPDNIYVYELDVSCTDRSQCPKIGGREKFAHVFPEHKGEMRMSLIQDGITYMFSGEVNHFKDILIELNHKYDEKADYVTAFENKVKKQVFNETQFWNFDNITSVVLYQWRDHNRYAIKMFLPTQSHKELKPRWALQTDSIEYFDSKDRHRKVPAYYTVEAKGNYEAINFVRTARSLFYTFGDYLLCHDMMAYLPLPGGDAIVTKPYTTYYVRQNGMVCNYESIPITN